jgi:hypothetical protein
VGRRRIVLRRNILKEEFFLKKKRIMKDNKEEFGCHGVSWINRNLN